MLVGELLVGLGFKVDKGSLAFANRTIGSIRRAALGLGGAFGLKGLGSALIGFNQSLEDGRNQIAGMLALSRKTNLTDELATADTLVANLQKRAASLPGTTEEYVKMLGNIAQPVIAAGLSTQDLEDMTVNSVVAAKALGITQVAAARDVEQAIRGQLGVRDQLTSRLLKNLGIEDAADRKRFNAMTMRERAEFVKRALLQKQVSQMGDQFAKSFSGRVDKFTDNIKRFFGRIGKGLFGSLGQALERINKWFDENQKAINEWADAIGEGIKSFFEFFAEGGDEAKAILISLGVLAALFAINMLLAAAPLILIAATVGLIAYGLLKLLGLSDDLGDMWRDGADGAEDLALTTDNLANRLEAGLQAAGERIKKVLGDAWDAVGLKVEEFVDEHAFWMGAGSLAWSHDQKAKRTGGRKWGDLAMEAPTVNNPLGGGRYLGDPGLDVAENGRTAYAPGAFGGSSEKGISVSIGDVHIQGVSDEKRMADIMSGEFATILRRSLAAQNGGGK